ncbi:MAG: hypothetical protein ABI859_16785 [Pseudomonadota bacterium]
MIVSMTGFVRRKATLATGSLALAAPHPDRPLLRVRSAAGAPRAH